MTTPRAYDLKALADATGISHGTLRQRDYRGGMPAPTWRLSIGKVWYGLEIETWITEQRHRQRERAGR